MIRPLLLEAKAAPRPSLLARARTFFLERWRGRIVLAALVLWPVDGLLSLAGSELPAVLSVPAAIVRWLFFVWLLWRALLWLTGPLLWRIRTKLIVSYLFIALVPVVLLTLFMCVAGVLLMGLTASRLVTSEVDRTGDVLLAMSRMALEQLPASDAEAARQLPARLAPARELHAGVAYTLLRGGRVVAHAGAAPETLPAWLKAPSFRSLVAVEREDGSKSEVLRAVRQEGEAALVVELPVDAAFLGEIEKRTAIHVLDRSELVERRDPRDGRAPRPARSGRRQGRARDGGPPLQGQEGSRPAVRRLPRPHGLGHRRDGRASRERRGRSSTTRACWSGGSRRSSCRGTRAGAACPTCCSTRSASWGPCSS
jgi:hypothetical protein